MMNHNDFPKMTEEFAPDWLPRCASAEPHLPQMHRAGFRCCFRMAETRISKGMCRRRTTPS